MNCIALAFLGIACICSPAWAAVQPMGPTPLTIKLDDQIFPSSPGYHTITGTMHFGDKEVPFASGIFLPPMFFETDHPLPVVVTLHNRGPSGRNGAGIFYEGLAAMLSQDNPDTRGTGDQPRHPMVIRTQAAFIGVAPQCPSGYLWETPPMGAYIAELTTLITRHYHADTERMYLTGFSYGASSTWRIALQVPGFFAAIAPLDGRASPDPVHDLMKLRNVGIFVGVGAVDTNFIPESERMRNALVTLKHPSFLYTLVPHGNHHSYGSVYSDQDFWYWMFTHRRGGKILISDIVTVRPELAATGNSSTTAPATSPLVNVDELGPKMTSPVPTTQATILCQYWRDMPGPQIKTLMDDPAYPRYPSEQIYLDRMEIPPNQEAGYATVLRGLLRPPTDGAYTFYIASDNEGEIWLSPDGRSDAKVLAKIANVTDWALPRSWTRKPEQESKPVELKAANSYFIEIRHKSGGGDNNLAVAWKLPDGTLEGPISGSHFIAVPASKVPPPAVSAIETSGLPMKPGTYRMKIVVELMGRRQRVPVLVILPRTFGPGVQCPALIFTGDTTTTADADGFRMAGPVKQLGGSEHTKLAEWSPFIVIAPQCPPGTTYDHLLVQMATATAIVKLLDDLPVDRERVYLTGNGNGATFSWKVAKLLGSHLTALAPVLTDFVKDPKLVAALDGVRVHEVTGVKDGMATDAANRMKDQLMTLNPPPDVVYEMDMGQEVADAYFNQQEFYQWFLSWHRAAGKAAESK